MDEKVKDYIVLREMVELAKTDLDKIGTGFKGAVCRAVGSRIWGDMRALKQQLRNAGVWVGPLLEERYTRTCQVTQRGQIEVLRITPAQLREWIEERQTQYAERIADEARREVRASRPPCTSELGRAVSARARRPANGGMLTWGCGAFWFALSAAGRSIGRRRAARRGEFSLSSILQLQGF